MSKGPWKLAEDGWGTYVANAKGDSIGDIWSDEYKPLISVAPEAVALLHRLFTLDGDGLFWERFHQLQADAEKLIARAGETEDA